MGARVFDDETRPIGRPLLARARALASGSEDQTVRIWQSTVLQGLKRPPNPASRVEYQEQVRCEILSALEAALADTVEFKPTPAIPVVLAPLAARPNPFLEPRLPSDPPVPWAASRTRPRRRSYVPLFAIAMAVAIALGLCADRNARGEIASVTKAHAKVVRAHAAKVLRR